MDRPIDGEIYGAPPVPPQEVPDVQAMLDTEGIPEGCEEEGGLPYSLEWYAGAKDRAAQRELELKEHHKRKNELRTDWVEVVLAELSEWRDKATRIATEEAPKDLGLLLAQTAAERPGDTAAIGKLKQLNDAATDKRDRLDTAFKDVISRLSETHRAVLEKEDEDDAAELARQEAEAAAKKRKAEVEEMLRQANETAQRKGRPKSAQPSPEGSPRVAEQEQACSPSPLVRGGAGRALPPLQNAPAPPSPPLARAGLADLQAERPYVSQHS